MCMSVCAMPVSACYLHGTECQCTPDTEGSECVHTHARTHTSMRIHTNTHIKHKHKHTYTRAHTRKHTHTHIHAHTDTPNISINTHTCTHARKHTQVGACCPSQSPPRQSLCRCRLKKGCATHQQHAPAFHLSPWKQWGCTSSRGCGQS